MVLRGLGFQATRYGNGTVALGLSLSGAVHGYAWVGWSGEFRETDMLGLCSNGHAIMVMNPQAGRADGIGRKGWFVSFCICSAKSRRARWRMLDSFGH